MGLPPNLFFGGQQTDPQQQQQPDPLTASLMNGSSQQPQPQPDQPQQPPPANNSQNAGPVKSGLRSVLAQMLSNFSYGAGQSMIKASGGETDAERATRLAQTAHLNAQTQLIQQQAQMTPVQPYGPNGPTVYMPASAAAGYFKQLAANQGKTGEATITGQYGLQREAMKQQFLTGQVSKLVPGINPDTQQPSMQMLNKQGQPIGWVENSIVPALMARTSNTTEYKEDENGNIIALPKTTTRGVVLPTAPGQPANKPAVAPGTPVGIGRNTGIKGKGAAVMMVGTDPQGRQVAGTPGELQQAGVQNFVKLGSSEADKVNTARQLTGPGGLFDLVNQDLAQFKPGELTPLNSRLQEFLAGTYGSGDPRYVALRTHLNGLLGTAMMQAHVGARGGENMMEHFENIAQAGKMDADTLSAALNAEKQYVTEKAMRPTPKAAASASGSDPFAAFGGKKR